MAPCPRCGRYHVGLCGVPPGVTKGFGAKASHARKPDALGPTRSGTFGSKRPGTGALKRLLAWGQEEQAKVEGLLNVVLPEMPEYDQLMERLDKLQHTVAQARLQLADRGE